MLDRIGRTVRPCDCYKKIAYPKNVQLRLDEIKKYIPRMTPCQQAMTFAWAFAIERQGDSALRSLGFFKGWKDFDYIWISCRRQIPQYLYALMEYTNIEVYGKRMRSAATYHSHGAALAANQNVAPTETQESFSPDWQKMMDGERNEPDSMRYLFNCLFPEGDAPGVV